MLKYKDEFFKKKNAIFSGPELFNRPNAPSFSKLLLYSLRLNGATATAHRLLGFRLKNNKLSDTRLFAPIAKIPRKQ